MYFASISFVRHKTAYPGRMLSRMAPMIDFIFDFFIQRRRLASQPAGFVVQGVLVFLGGRMGKEGYGDMGLVGSVLSGPISPVSGRLAVR